MVIPALIKRTCSTCKTLREFRTSQAKKNPLSSLTASSRRKDRSCRGVGNKGKYSKVPAGRVKKSRHPNLVLRCSTCTKGINLPRPRCVRYELRR